MQLAAAVKVQREGSPEQARAVPPEQRDLEKHRKEPQRVSHELARHDRNRQEGR